MYAGVKQVSKEKPLSKHYADNSLRTVVQAHQKKGTN